MGVPTLRHQEPAIKVGVRCAKRNEVGASRTIRTALVIQTMTSGQTRGTDKLNVQWKSTKSMKSWRKNGSCVILQSHVCQIHSFFRSADVRPTKMKRYKSKCRNIKKAGMRSRRTCFLVKQRRQNCAEEQMTSFRWWICRKVNFRRTMNNRRCFSSNSDKVSKKEGVVLQREEMVTKERLTSARRNADWESSKRSSKRRAVVA